jgi:hypothetical protein
MPFLSNHPPSRVRFLYTLGTPHRAPVLVTDEWMKRIYRVVNGEKGKGGDWGYLAPLVLESPSSSPLLHSLTGGLRDFQISPSLSGVSNLAGIAFGVLAHAMEGRTVGEGSGLPQTRYKWESGSVDHPCLCWCKQIIEVLAYAIREGTMEMLHGRGEGENERKESMEKQKRIWLPEVLPMLKEIASSSRKHALSSSSSPSSSSSSSHCTVFDSDFASAAKDGTVRSSDLAVSAAAPGGVVFVWNGLLSSLQLCSSSSSSSSCFTLTSHTRLLSPGLHPELKALGEKKREEKRIGVMSTYMVYITKEDLQTLLPSASSSVHFLLTPSTATLSVYQSLRPMRGGKRRMLGYGFTVNPTLMSSPSSPPFGLSVLSYPLPLGVDLHQTLTVEIAATEQQEHHLPQLIVMSGRKEEGGGEGKEDVDYEEQIFTFYPESDGIQGGGQQHHKKLHFYRSGVQGGKAEVMMIRIPTVEEDFGSPSTLPPPLPLSLHTHTFYSFLSSYFLQAPLLPQLLLGSALIVFGVQHEYLRKHGVFPRIYELFLTPSTTGLLSFFHSSLLWSFGFIAVLCALCFHGNGHEDALQQSREEAGEVAGSVAMLSGWSLYQGDWQMGLIGFVLFLSCIALLVMLEAVIYFLLYIGAYFLQSLFSLLSLPFHSLSLRSLPHSSLTSAQKYWSISVRRVIMIGWVLATGVAGVFTSLLALFALQYFGGIGVRDFLYFLLQQIVAWISTALSIFRLIDEHFYLEKDILSWCVRVLTFDSDVAILPLIFGLVLLAFCIQMCTFPLDRMKGGDSPKRRAALSAAAYKTAGMTMVIVVMVILLFPSFLASFRLSVSSIDAQWSQADQQGRLLFFQPPGARKGYDESMVKPAVVYNQDGSPSTTTSPPSLFLYPFVVRSTYDPLSVIVLTWVTLMSWCMMHTPFSPPILQAACITTHGLALIFVHGPAVSFLNFWWIVLMLCLCVIPHAMASGLYVVNLMMDFAEGREGFYEQVYEQEKDRHQAQANARQHPQAPATAAAKLPNAADQKKRK